MFLKRGPYFEEEAGGEQGAPAGGEFAPGAAGLPAPGEQIVPAETQVKPADMLAEIDKGLKYAEKTPVLTPEEKTAADAKTAEEKAVKERDAKALAGDPAAVQAKQEAERKATEEAKKPKDLKALELTDAEKKAFPASTQKRISELLTISNTERTRAETAESQVKVLAQSRDAIMGVLQETKTSDQDLAQLLEFNRLVKTGDPASLEQALAVVNHHRVNILKALGREGDGYDPLAQHADLQKELAENSITRARALEIAGARQREATANAQRDQGQRTHQAEQQRQQEHQRALDTGLQSIDQWVAKISTSDIDFKAKEDILLTKIDGIIKQYPPNLWLPTIEAVYSAIAVHKAPAPLPSVGNNSPLRSSGAKPGSPAPTNMMEAISGGLGYGK